MHLLIFLFFMSIFLYLGLKNANGVAASFNSGGPQLVHETATLQGR